MASFILTTNKESAEAIEKLSASQEFLKHKSLKIGKITHHDGYSDVHILSSKENGLIEPKDIFWLGWVAGSVKY